MAKATKKPARAKAGTVQRTAKRQVRKAPPKAARKAGGGGKESTTADVVQVFAEAFAAIVSQIDAQGPDRRSGQALGQAESLTRAIQERLTQRLGAPPSAAQLQVLSTLSSALAATAPARQVPAAEAPTDNEAHEAYVQWHLEMFGRPPTGRR